MISLQPTELFADDKALSSPWRDEVRKRSFHEAAVYSLAKLALGGATAEQLAGAREFLRIFMNCAEPQEAIHVASPPRLDYDVERRVAERHAKKE